MPLVKKSKQKFTYQDYLTWPDEERWELIGGVAYNMTPAPSTRHQTIILNFTRVLDKYLEDKPCTLFLAPTDVVLSEYDVVQPDLLVVCDKNKITEANIQGAPDLVVEILSPSTAPKDKREKKALYERFGIREYLLIEPTENYLKQFCLAENGRYRAGKIWGPDDVVVLFSLEGIKITLGGVFVPI